MKEKCFNHPDKKAISYCHSCGKYFCEDCLSIGKFSDTVGTLPFRWLRWQSARIFLQKCCSELSDCDVALPKKAAPW